VNTKPKRCHGPAANKADPYVFVGRELCYNKPHAHPGTTHPGNHFALISGEKRARWGEVRIKGLRTRALQMRKQQNSADVYVGAEGELR
jgi:hypothetical protein